MLNGQFGCIFLISQLVIRIILVLRLWSKLTEGTKLNTGINLFKNPKNKNIFVIVFLKCRRKMELNLKNFEIS